MKLARKHRPARAKPARELMLTMTDARTHGAHLITDEAFTAGCHIGRYRAVCGTEVLAASLTTPESSYCKCCTRWWAAR